MSRRGSRWEGRARRGAGRLLERVRDLKSLALRDLRAMERPPGTPSEIELGVATRDEEQPVGIVASRRAGLDLLGWGQLLSSLPGGPPASAEVILVSPLVSARTRRAAQRAAASGSRLRLVTVPALAEASEELLAQELFPCPSEVLARGPDPGSVLDRVARIIEGAAAITACGGLRWTPSGYLLYIRGICVLHVVSEGDAVAVAFTAPDKRRIHVGEANFPRWGVELHEAVIQLAQDPRLLTDELANAERAIEQQATAAGCRVVGRWLPWNTDGSNPVDWVGVDANGRPVLGVVRASATLADVPGWIAALHVLEEERERWVPDAQGPPRLLISSERDDSKLRSVLADSGLDAELCSPAPAAEDTGEPERRGRRRPRRRRRERGDGAGWQRPAASEAEERPSEERPSEERAVAVTSGSEAAFAEEAPESADSGPREPEYEPSVEVPDDEESPLESEEEAFVEPEEPLREEGRWERPRALETSETAAPVEESAAEEVSSSYPLEMEIEATLAEEREEAEAEPGEPIETTPVRRRNPRAAIVVRNTPDSILAALILARDRRNLLFFWVCSQEGLMDFFKGRATDLPENVDLLLVGFTAQPIPQEVISTVTLFRGRTQWFDHHEWPIEDLERLRDALGREAILFEPGAASPLAAVVPVTERRSRFTDKLVDLAGRRLSENDMAKWGYRVADLLDRLVAKEGDHRAEIVPVLSGKPSELPGGESVYEAEHAWIDEHDARIVHFGEYQMVVVRVPPDLDAGEVARRGRLRTGARLSLASREGDDLVLLGCNDEKRHINMSDIIECLSSRLPWAHAVSGGDRTGRLRIENLSDNPERIETIIGEIVKNRSILYG